MNGKRKIMTEERNGGIKKIIIAVIIIVIIAAAGVIARKRMKVSTVVDTTKYQAVFLSNGQTYFGKVKNEKETYVSLNDVYYMILKQPLQDQNNSQDQAKPEYTLVRLGKELHGPTSMAINRSQILFIENLADDSKVVSAINSSQK